VCFDELGRSTPHLFLYLVLLFKKKMETKRETLLVEELSLYSNIFVFFKREQDARINTIFKPK
jgi:hypothetical protein